MKRVLINGLLLNGRFSGVQHSIENLLSEIDSSKNEHFEFTVLVGKNYEGKLKKRQGFEIKSISKDTRSRIKRIFYENLQLPKRFKKSGYDLYHSTAYVLPYISKMPSVLTVHDIIALDYPKLCTPENALYFNLVLPSSIRNADRIIAVSNTVKKDILRAFPFIDPDKISVVYNGIGSHFKKITAMEELNRVALKYELPVNFLLYVGNIEPKKNLIRVVDAFYKLKTQQNIVHKLVLAGNEFWNYEPVFRLIEKYGLRNEVLAIGHVADEDLPAIYSLADIFVFPSLYEGFGIPPLEAMACETPTIISNRGALPEVTGLNCYAVNPENSNELAQTIYRLLQDTTLKYHFVSDALSWSKKFSWQRAAQQTIEIYNHAMHNV